MLFLPPFLIEQKKTFKPLQRMQQLSKLQETMLHYR